jgi:hypothetical protein
MPTSLIPLAPEDTLLLYTISPLLSTTFYKVKNTMNLLEIFRRFFSLKIYIFFFKIATFYILATFWLIGTEPTSSCEKIG